MNNIQKSEHRLLQVLLVPIVSEKATMLAEKYEQVMFKVIQNATKLEVKFAIELIFKVKVESVKILNRKGKIKRFGRSIGRHNHSRRAIVNLQAGQTINLDMAEAV